MSKEFRIELPWPSGTIVLENNDPLSAVDRATDLDILELDWLSAPPYERRSHHRWESTEEEVVRRFGRFV